MTRAMPAIYRVRDWNENHENNRSRELKTLLWIPVPNDLGADRYVELVSHPDGAAHLGVWIALLMIASKGSPRGYLVREDGRPHNEESVAVLSRLPKQLIEEAITRLLEVGLLELCSNRRRRINNVPPHPAAGESHRTASKSPHRAQEGKGTEHHHQEGNGIEKKRTERPGDNSATQRSGAVGAQPDFPKNGDDGEKPGTRYATPEDELKAIYYSKAGSLITLAVLDAIRLNLERNRVSMAGFVSGLRSHLAGNWKNPAGFLLSFSKQFRSKSQPASDPVTAAEAAERNYKCAICDSGVRGEGAILSSSGKAVPCQCASPEYITQMRTRGIFAKDESR